MIARLAALALALLPVACAQTTTAAPATPTVPVVYVVQRGWHTDIALPLDEMTPPLAGLQQNFPGVRFMVFGFGEREYVLTREADIFTMLRALLPSRSAMLITALGDPPQAAFGEAAVVALPVSREGLAAIEAAIWLEFDTAAGQPVLLGNGPYPGSIFAAARDSYSAAYTCNSWTAETLRAGGLAMPGTGILFASQVMGPARWLGRQ